MKFSTPKNELTENNWLEKLPVNGNYTLCAIEIGEPLSELLKQLGEPLEIKEDSNKSYHVYYYSPNGSSKIGFQVINSKISGFTLINDHRYTTSDILGKLGEITAKDTMIGQIFSMWDYEIDGYIYHYDQLNLKVKLDEKEKAVSTFYFGEHWTKIVLETFPSEIH